MLQRLKVKTEMHFCFGPLPADLENISGEVGIILAL
jgi:hypothetical protein